jgi:hypothetical protein
VAVDQVVGLRIVQDTLKPKAQVAPETMDIQVVPVDLEIL